MTVVLVIAVSLLKSTLKLKPTIERTKCTNRMNELNYERSELKKERTNERTNERTSEQKHELVSVWIEITRTTRTTTATTNKNDLQH